MGDLNPKKATQLQGVDISETAPADGQVLEYNATSGEYEPITPTGGGQTDTVVGSSGITNVGTNVDADLAPTYGVGANTVCEGDDARLSDARTPTSHAASHTDGTDDVQDATAAQKGLATAAQITKLDGIAAGADVTGNNPPQAHTHTHASTTGQGTDDHHTKSHNHDTASGAGAIATDQALKAGDGGTTDYFETAATTGIVALHGAAKFKSEDSTWSYNIAGQSGTYNGVSCNAAGSGVLSERWYANLFDDGGGAGQAEAVVAVLEAPKGADGTTDVVVELNLSAQATSGNMRVGVGVVKVGTGDDLTAAGSYIVKTIAKDAVAWQGQLEEFTMTGVTAEAGHYYAIVVYRDADDAADTMSGDMALFALGLECVNDKLGGA